MRLMGKGKAKDFKAKKDETLVEIGTKVYAVPDSAWCTVCEGAGCKDCKFTGLEATRLKRKKKKKNN